MIDRYSRPRMSAIWASANKYEMWLKVELLACEAMVREGEVPESAFNVIRSKARIDPDRIDALEKVVKHDVIAFLSSITEKVGEEGRFLHMGMTSSDVLDTALALQMREAADLLIEDLVSLLELLKEKAVQYKETIMIGRSHGIHGEPVTFGLKIAIWYAEMERNLVRMREAREIISFGKISGAMGTYAHLSPSVEDYVCGKLGLKPEPVSNQIVQRDRHAQYLQALALIAASLEKFSVEIRHLQRTEVLEAEEPFETGQKGSSAMPHKRNPVGSENICGLARVIRSNASAALEDIPLWHERDISHSSVERIILPDSTVLLDYMLVRFTKIMRGLVVYPDRMRQNLERTGGTLFSQKVLICLIKKGMEREEAYEMVQRTAMSVYEKGGSFKESLKKDHKLSSYLSAKEVDACFDPKQYLLHIDRVYKRVFHE
ncbi:MAG: adenylosuccinate lyase [Nitrospira sp.]|nr:adenylosuccinate lyase [Candidatus Manganitrophaceae bacterium]HIL34499.1 adenylosuccinate lyase [Candidatus Manganitrophaceae bacterium]